MVHKRKEFDAIIIETTGLADPAPIVFTFNSNALIQDNFRIDSVVCLVDSKHISIHLDDVKPEGDVNEAEHQVAFADRIVLNKIDLVDPETLEDVEDRIRSINSFAEIIKCEKSRVPLDKILGLNSFSLQKLEEMDPTFMQEDEEEEHGHHHDHVHSDSCGCGSSHDHGGEHGHNDEHGHGHEHGHEHEHGHGHDSHCSADCSDDHEHGHGHECHDDHCKDESHNHDHSAAAEGETKKRKKKHNLSLISSVGFTVEGLLKVQEFNDFMSKLLQAKGKDLYRTKGVLAFADQGDLKFVFQGVHEQINFGPAEKPWNEGEHRLSKLVFIGKNIDYEELKNKLVECCEDPAKSIVTMHKRG